MYIFSAIAAAAYATCLRKFHLLSQQPALPLADYLTDYMQCPDIVYEVVVV